ncbi:MAG: hypothetical protein ACRDGI_03565, partial [Candidatus Limnocylindrales bacterium]
VDLREVVDAPDAPWSRLGERLAGGAVPSLSDALADLVLEPEHERIRLALRGALRGRASPAHLIAAAGTTIRGLDVERLRLGRVIRESLAEAGLPPADLDRGVGLSIAFARVGAGGDVAGSVLVHPGLSDQAVHEWFADSAIRAGLRVSTWDRADYVEREAWLLWLDVVATSGGRPAQRRRRLLAQAAEAGGYRVDRVLAESGAPIAATTAATTRRPRPGPVRGGATGRGSRGSSPPPDGGAGRSSG